MYGEAQITSCPPPGGRDGRLGDRGGDSRFQWKRENSNSNRDVNWWEM